MKMLAEERSLRDYINGKTRLTEVYSPTALRMITAFKRAVEDKSFGLAAERAFAEYLRMFGDSKQNITRAGQIVAAIRARDGRKG